MSASSTKRESPRTKVPMTNNDDDLFGEGAASARRSGSAKAATAKVSRALSKALPEESGYDASDIEVLEGLEPVRRRPGMYIGGTDEKAFHHLFAEVIDNAMDEAVAGHATFIEVEVEEGGWLSVTDNGRGIPVDPHPKFPKKSALEGVSVRRRRDPVEMHPCPSRRGRQRSGGGEFPLPERAQGLFGPRYRGQ